MAAIAQWCWMVAALCCLLTTASRRFTHTQGEFEDNQLTVRADGRTLGASIEHRAHNVSDEVGCSGPDCVEVSHSVNDSWSRGGQHETVSSSGSSAADDVRRLAAQAEHSLTQVAGKIMPTFSKSGNVYEHAATIVGVGLCVVPCLGSLICMFMDWFKEHSDKSQEEEDCPATRDTGVEASASSSGEQWHPHEKGLEQRKDDGKESGKESGPDSDFIVESQTLPPLRPPRFARDLFRRADSTPSKLSGYTWDPIFSGSDDSDTGEDISDKETLMGKGGDAPAAACEDLWLGRSGDASSDDGDDNDPEKKESSEGRPRAATHAAAVKSAKASKKQKKAAAKMRLTV